MDEMYMCQSYYDDGLDTEVEQEVQEVSMDEVAKAMGISVGSLRIKKEL